MTVATRIIYYDDVGSSVIVMMMMMIYKRKNKGKQLTCRKGRVDQRGFSVVEILQGIQI